MPDDPTLDTLKQIQRSMAELGSRMDTSLTALSDRVSGLQSRMDDDDKRRMDDDDKKRRADARMRCDAFKFTKRADDDDDDKFKRRRDAEEEALGKEFEEAGEEPPKAKEMAADRRKKADDDDDAHARGDDDTRRSDARKRADAFEFQKEEGDDDDDDKKRSDRRARRDAEEEQLAGHLREAGESDDDARKHARDARRKADDDDDDRRRRRGIRGDSSLADRIKRLEDANVRSDDELDQLATLQHEWSAVSQAHGERPQRPLDGESPHSFDRRNAKRFQKFSPKWKDADLTVLPPNVLSTINREIRADAIAEAYKGATTSGLPELREIRKYDDTGRVIREFVGDVSATLAPFKIPAMRVRAINTHPNTF